MTEERAREIATAGFNPGTRVHAQIVELILSVCAEERKACAEACREECVDIDCSAIEAESVVRRTRNALAQAIEGMK
jgi:hypothetical protein